MEVQLRLNVLVVLSRETDSTTEKNAESAKEICDLAAADSYLSELEDLTPELVSTIGFLQTQHANFDILQSAGHAGYSDTVCVCLCSC